MVGGLRAVNSECFSKLWSYIHAWISSKSCMPHDLGPRASRGASGSCTHNLDLIAHLEFVYQATVLGNAQSQLAVRWLRPLRKIFVSGGHILLRSIYVQCLDLNTWQRVEQGLSVIR